jgi:hypothetical protein
MITEHKIVDFYTLNYYLWYEYHSLVYNNINKGLYETETLISSNIMLFNYDFNLI